MEGMKKAYAVGLYGADPRVIDGTWQELFPDEAEGPTEVRAFPDAMLGN
jgi:cryptochrome